MATNRQPPNKELQSYKDAVWAFMLEHSDVMQGGSYFVKFHVSHRQNFENRILSRWVYGYHRKDERLGLSHDQKEKMATSLREAHISRKISKQRHREQARERRIMAQMPPEVMHTEPVQAVAPKWYDFIKLWPLNRRKVKQTIVSPVPTAPMQAAKPD